MYIYFEFFIVFCFVINDMNICLNYEQNLIIVMENIKLNFIIIC